MRKKRRRQAAFCAGRLTGNFEDLFFSWKREGNAWELTEDSGNIGQACKLRGGYEKSRRDN